MAFLRFRKKKCEESPREGEKDEYPGLPPVWRGQTWGPVGQKLYKVIGPPSPLAGVVTTASPTVIQGIVSLVDVNPKAPLRGTGEIAWVLAAAWQEQTGALDRSATLECKQRQQMEKLEKENDRLWKIVERLTVHVAAVKRRQTQKTPRKAEPKLVRAFIAEIDDEWDPASWDGNIWGDDEGGGGAFDERERYRPDPPPRPAGLQSTPPIYPSLSGVSEIKPITRRREERRVLPPVMVQVTDNAGVPQVDADGVPVMVEQEQQQPAPQLTMIREDYTQDEIAYMTSQYKQQSQEPPDIWLNRLFEGGADNVDLDAGDAARFGGLSSDNRVNVEMRAHARTIGNDSLSLLTLYSMAVQAIYPTWHDWPPITGQWGTLREAITRLTRYCVREAVSRDGMVTFHEDVIPRAARDALIRDAPPQYRAAVLTVLMGALENDYTAVKTRLQELAALGDWKAAPPLKTEDWGKSVRNEGNGSARDGPPRSALWRALIQAGVRKEEIDGLPTSELAQRCRQKGLKVSTVQSVSCNREMMQGLTDVLRDLRDTMRPVFSAPPSEESESEGGEEEVEIAAVRKRRDKGKGKGKGKKKHKIDYRWEEGDEY